MSAKIIDSLDIAIFKQIIEDYKSKLSVSAHALDHLSIAQRKILNEDSLKKIVLSEEPRGIGIQKNGRYAVYYRRTDGFLKIILEKKEQRLEVITFINADSMPTLGKLR
ncbi:hypothetical protein J4219_00760 [Candidatus Woesearchaeota archaeon]|nr:hypothetical protein [Candidatus Woesearchaeota archaeon]